MKTVDRDESSYIAPEPPAAPGCSSDEVLVLNEGSVVERGATLEVIRDPGDDHTERLLAAVPTPLS